MKIGNVQIENDLALGPMAGVTDLTFRVICKEMGCGLVFTEMVSAKGIYYGDKKTEKLLKIEESERPVALQIFGSEPEIMAKVAEKLNNHNHDILDINMGCPTPKIVKNGDGSALLKNPKLIGRIVKSVVRASEKPVTVKIRKGWDESSINAVEVAKIIEQNGAKAISIHGRTREQFYTGKADWEIIKKVKEAVNIPVFGNGDVFTIEDAKAIKETTNCDGIMIARGAQGNPWIFKRINHYFQTGEILPPPSVEEKVSMCFRHLDMLIDNKGEYIAIREIRKHAAWYLKGIKNSAKIRNEINKSTSIKEIKNCLEKILNNL
ncbi:tRNA-U20-dihydrouridine synthase [Caminicella sporogenes DSM 14501]|uniref:tRNA-dihydrouridine synthase n=1 Tax=Caminicella sporogenes DSM 14501 TaxID=1121266 RepID=A0A1M6QR10_9FIRM|nr:tRNA dihydrouridine synthase DusB [Caminicella sporogenes]RKD20946.1 tRNA dihydrouridine synthase DusB [Caminicella sporogenes]SHK22664.1 tRNA-U20-dihydrouridine synthase [Caminicella sporogenes DSM 14501]